MQQSSGAAPDASGEFSGTIPPVSGKDSCTGVGVVVVVVGGAAAATLAEAAEPPLLTSTVLVATDPPGNEADSTSIVSV